MDKVRNGVGLIGLPTMCCFLHASNDQALEAILYLKGLFRLIEKHPDWKRGFKGSGSLLAKLNVAIACGVCFGSIFGAFALVFGLHWGSPCKASLFGYWIIPECNGSGVESSLSNNFLKFAVMFVNYLIFCFGSQASVQVIGILQCLGTTILLDCLKIFWLQLEEEKSPCRVENKCLVFREVQVLGKLNNSIQRGMMTTSMLGCIIILLGFCLTATVITLKQSRIEPEGEFGIPLAFFGVLTFGYFFLILVALGGMSRIHQESTLVLGRINWHRSE